MCGGIEPMTCAAIDLWSGTERDAAIIRARRKGFSVKHIAKEFKLSVTRIYGVIFEEECRERNNDRKMFRAYNPAMFALKIIEHGVNLIQDEWRRPADRLFPTHDEFQDALVVCGGNWIWATAMLETQAMRARRG